jgi:sulfur carrier protein ThiS
VPEFRRKNPDASVPGLDKQRLQIKGTLTDARVNKNVENLLRELKQNAEIVILEKSKPAIPKSQPPKKD